MTSGKQTFGMVLFLAFCLVAVATSVSAQEIHRRSLRFTIDPAVSRTFGHTTYRMDIRSDGTGLDEITHLASELEYPLDQTMLGVRFRLSSVIRDAEDWSVSLTAHRSVSNPGGTMFDSDWIAVVDGFDGKFSYTESKSEATAVIAVLEITKSFLNKRDFNLSALAGFRYQRIEQDIDNFFGWQINYTAASPQRFYFSVDDIPALEYRVTYATPHLGLKAVFQRGPTFDVTVQAAFGLTLADDYDNHLLRNKEADGEGRGQTFMVGFTLSHQLRREGDGPRPFIGLEGEFLKLSIDGDQNQFWYDDEVIVYIDPNTGQRVEEVVVPQGTRFTNLPHDFSSTQFRLGLRAGFLF
jgi:hypothetical protein